LIHLNNINKSFFTVVLLAVNVLPCAYGCIGSVERCLKQSSLEQESGTDEDFTICWLY